MNILDVPYEIWEKIVFYDRTAFNVLTRAIPKLGRKTLDPAFQDYVIEKFKLYEDILDKRIIKINELHHSIYDKPALVFNNGTKKWFHCGLLHRDNKPAVVWSCGIEEWWTHGKKVW